MADSEREVCILCDKEMEEGIIHIGEKPIKSLIKASKEIGDRKHLKMEHLLFLNVHKACQVQYLKPSNIKTQKQSILDRIKQTRKDNKEARKFDFSSLCFFGGTDATTDTHKRPIKLVSNDNGIKENIFKILESRPDDDFHKNLRLRLEHTVDLEKKKARYHAKCMRQFNYTQSPNKVGRPMDENTSTVTSHY